MAISIESVRTVSGYLQKIFSFPPTTGIRCFRGEANAEWPLKPSVMRSLKPEAEHSIITELMAESPEDFATDRSVFDRLVRAQHYGLPTRLLDVSLNPLVGLYFACADDPVKEEDGKVVILDFEPKQVKYPDSDTVSLICNLARLSDSERDELQQAAVEDRVSAAEFQGLRSTSRLLQFVRMEKPYFLNEIRPMDFRRYYFVHPSKTNRRVVAQSGAFVATGLLAYKSIHRAASFSSRQIIVPASSKAYIIRQLDLLNINSRSLFPEIEFTSRYIKRKWELERTSDLEDLLGDVFQ